MDEDLVRLRADLAEAQAQATFAGLVAQLAFSIATMDRAPAEVQAFVRLFGTALITDKSQFPADAALAARTAGLFATFARRHGVELPPG